MHPHDPTQPRTQSPNSRTANSRRRPRTTAASRPASKLFTPRSLVIHAIAVLVGLITGFSTSVTALGTTTPVLAYLIGIPAGITAAIATTAALDRLV
ncbi:hypothetical protein [Longispora albida]|uniref:hypothetical protein n=1 Tax=Longispora albida TaxID=203523 RepID=UPI0003A72331|nr:hypothetical protein [Longispora albida]